MNNKQNKMLTKLADYKYMSSFPIKPHIYCTKATSSEGLYPCQCIIIKYQWTLSQIAHCSLINPRCWGWTSYWNAVKRQWQWSTAQKQNAFLLLENYAPSICWGWPHCFDRPAQPDQFFSDMCNSCPGCHGVNINCPPLQESCADVAWSILLVASC